MDRGAWRAMVHVVTKRWEMTEVTKQATMHCHSLYFSIAFELKPILSDMSILTQALLSFPFA